jgi:TonB family protein
MWSLLVALSGAGMTTVLAQTTDAPSATYRRVKVPETDASALVVEKKPLKYPDAARNAGIQGVVVLNVVVAETGEVKEVSVATGDPVLAQAAADAVRQWKYKPYIVDQAPVEMETQVSINFHIKAEEHIQPPWGTFRDEKYSNDFFDFEYRLSPDWVRETQAVRKRVSAGGPSPDVYILLAAVHIPQKMASLEADSSFVLSAIDSGGRSCEQYLTALADSLRSRKEAQEKGAVVSLSVGGHDFRRADFNFRESPSHRSFLCTPSKQYLLQWNIAGLSMDAIESVVSTLSGIVVVQPKVPVAVSAPTNSNLNVDTQNKPQIVRVRIAQGISQGLIVKKVAPVYPPEAKYARIQGTVVLSAVINESGDVADLEVLDGPIELVVSAVNAVRQWKYRPYILNRQPVEVNTQITVNYALSGG